MNKLKIGLLAFVLIGAASIVKATGVQKDTALQGNQGVSVSPADHAVAQDGAGRIFPDISNKGWKVFESSGTAALALVKDSQGNAATSGILHEVCIDAGSGFAIAYDSSSVTGLTIGISAGAIGGQLAASSTLEECRVLDAQFQNGLVVGQSSASNESYFLWQNNLGGSR